MAFGTNTGTNPYSWSTVKPPPETMGTTQQSLVGGTGDQDPTNRGPATTSGVGGTGSPIPFQGPNPRTMWDSIQTANTLGGNKEFVRPEDVFGSFGSGGGWGTTGPDSFGDLVRQAGEMFPGGGAGDGSSAFPLTAENPTGPTTTGLEPGTPFMEGVDMTRQGAAEKFFSDYGGGFAKPGLSQTYAEGVMGRYGAGGPGVSNYSTQALGVAAGTPGPRNVQSIFDMTRGGVPADESASTLSSFRRSVPADTSKFFENASRKGAERLASSMSARGLYGSSATDDQLREMETDLSAREAMENAGYGLQRAGLEGTLSGAADRTALERSGLLGTLGGSADQATMARLGLLGNLSSGADASSLAGSSNALSWTRGIGDIMSGADATRLGGLSAGMGAAVGAQGAQRQRGQDAFGNQMAFGSAMSGTMGDEYDRMRDDDMNLLRDALTMYTGAGAEGYNQATRGAAQGRQDFGDLINLFGGVFSGTKGIYDSYNK